MGRKEHSSRRDLAVPRTATAPAARGRSVPAVRRPAKSEQTITPQFVIYALARWWKLAVPAALLLAGAAAAIVWSIFVPQYHAEAWLQIHEQRPVVAFDTEGRGPEKSFVSTQIQLIRSPMVLAPVVADPEIARMKELIENQGQDLIAWLGKHIQVTQVEDSQLFIVSYKAEDPKNASRVVNAVVDNYLQLRGQEDAQHTERILELLNEEKDQRAAEVQRLSDVVRDLAKRVTGRDPMLTGEPAVQALSPADTLRTKLIEAEVERRALEVQIKAYEETMAKRQSRVSELAVQNAVESSPAYVSMRQQVDQKRQEVVQTESLLSPGKQTTYLQKVKGDLDSAEKTLQTFRKELTERVREEMKAYDLENQRASIDEMQMKLASQRQTEQLLREQYQQELRDAEKLSGDAAELFFRQAELKQAMEVRDRIAERAIRLRTEQRAPARVTPLRAALPPPTPVETIPLRSLAIAIMAGLGLPFALALAWEMTIRRVHGSQVLEQESKLAVVGEVARLPVQPRVTGHSVTRKTKQDIQVFEESIDSLRTSLLLSNQFRGLRVLAVTSAAKHEGKTSVAVQLAVSIARATGERTLLIDGDMRSPDVHNVFDIPLEPGLSDVLEGRSSLADAVHTAWSEYLHLLPAGKLRASPHKLVGNDSLKQLLDQTAGKYRYVIVDTPPVLAAAEAIVLATSADACLVCAMRDVSRLDQVRKACERLNACGARSVGTILNGVPAKTYTYHYGSYAEA